MTTFETAPLTYDLFWFAAGIAVALELTGALTANHEMTTAGFGTIVVLALIAGASYLRHVARTRIAEGEQS